MTGEVHHVDAGIEADVDQSRCPLGIGIAPSLEEGVAAAECTGAKAQNRYRETGRAELSELHVISPQ